LALLNETLLIMIANFERRSQKRTLVRPPVRIRTAPSTAEVTSETRDISTNGVFLYTDGPMQEGSAIELVLILPSELAGGTKSWVCCQARVVRVEPAAGGGFGMAAAIERMDVLPELGGQ
jgi:hypothetical protein